MYFKQSRILNPLKLLGLLKPGEEFCLGFEVGDDCKKVTAKIGLPSDAGEGATILPRIVGPISRKNAIGHFEVHRDKPKERRFMYTLIWTWKEFAGRGRTVEKTGEKDTYRDCWQRTSYPPNAEELTLTKINSKWFIVSRKIQNGRESESEICHIANLILELFGEFQVLQALPGGLTTIVINKLNWRLLPPGNYPWEKIKEIISEKIRARDPRRNAPIIERQKFFLDLMPSGTYVGEGGFAEYMAYDFEKIGITILESISIDNAIYVFRSNWKAYSQMSKGQILQAGIHHARIVHNSGWKEKVLMYL